MTMRRVGDLVLLVITGALLLTATGVAWAAGMSVTTERLHVAALAPPVFHPTDVAVITNAKGGASPDRRDVIEVSFTLPVAAASICPGLLAVPLLGYTVTLTDGGAGNDLLTVTSGPPGCPSPRIGTFDLGTPGYLTAGTAIASGSEIRLVASPPGLSITLGSRPSPRPDDVAGPTLVRYTPHPALTDTTGTPVRGTAANTVQF